MHSGMPLYRNHFRRSRDAPEVNRDLFTLPASEVNRQHIDAGDAVGDSARRILHPLGREVIQTFWLPVSLIRVARMAKLVLRFIANDWRRLLHCGLMRRACLCWPCCRETMA